MYNLCGMATKQWQGSAGERSDDLATAAAASIPKAVHAKAPTATTQERAAKPLEKLIPANSNPRIGEEHSIDDVTEAVDAQIPAQMGASEILAPRMEELPKTGVGDRAGLLAGTRSKDFRASDNEEGGASRALGSSHVPGPSLPADTEPVVPNDFTEPPDASLAEMVRRVRPRPPTRLAAMGSSIVLLLVFGLWIGGESSASESELADNTSAESTNPEDAPALGARTDKVETREREAAERAEAKAKARASAAAARKAARAKAAEEKTAQAREAQAATEAAARESAEREAAEREAAGNRTTGSIFKAATKDEPSKNKSSKRGQRAAAEALYKKASMSFLQAKLGAAERDFKNALKADPSYWMPYRGLGLVHERRGNKTKAAAAFRRYLKHAPKAVDAKAIRSRLSRLGK